MLSVVEQDCATVPSWAPGLLTGSLSPVPIHSSGMSSYPLGSYARHQCRPHTTQEHLSSSPLVLSARVMPGVNS